MDNFIKLKWDNKNNPINDNIKMSYIDKPIFNCEKVTDKSSYEFYIPILNHLINRYNVLAKMLNNPTIPVIENIILSLSDFDRNSVNPPDIDIDITYDKDKPSDCLTHIKCTKSALKAMINSSNSNVFASSNLVIYIFESIAFLDDIANNPNKVDLIKGLRYECYNKNVLKDNDTIDSILKKDFFYFDNKLKNISNVGPSTKCGYLFIKSLRNIEESIIPVYDKILNGSPKFKDNNDLELFLYCNLEKYDRLRMLLFMYMHRYNNEYDSAVRRYNQELMMTFENEDDAPFYHNGGLFNTNRIEIRLQPFKITNYHNEYDRERDYRYEVLFIISNEDSLDKIYISANTDFQHPKLTDIAFDFTIQYMSKVCGIRNINMELERQFVNQVCSRVVYVDKNIQKEMSYKITKEEEKEGDEDDNE